MEQIYFWVFALTLIGMLLRGVASPERMYEYPYFMAAAFAVFILPQAISLLRFPGIVRHEDIEAVLLMSVLCLGMCLIGYRLPASFWLLAHTSVRVSSNRLLQGGIIFIVCGSVFAYLISQMSPEETGGSMWTGKVTILDFFAKLVYPGFSICLAIALQRGGTIPWACTILGALIPIQTVIFAGRRELAVVFALTLGLALFFQRRFIPPRSLVLGALVFAMLAIPTTGAYRRAMSAGSFADVREIDLLENFDRLLNEESILELRNAAMIMGAISHLGMYEYGTGYWDQLVFRFVPAQLIGSEMKEKLMFRTVDQHLDDELAGIGFQISTGSTVTGMGDSFQQLGYFGCLFFALMAVVYRSLWQASLHPNALFAQLLYILSMTSAMRAITHQTLDFLPGFLYNVIFLGALMWYARDRTAVTSSRVALSQQTRLGEPARR
jgi:hypothetical protein